MYRKYAKISNPLTKRVETNSADPDQTAPLNEQSDLGLHYLSRDMRSPAMWYVRPAKPQISLRICAV